MYNKCMSRGKPHKNTKHGIQRLYERIGITNKGDANSFAFNASSKGKNWDQLPDSPLKNYVKRKSRRHRVKLYKNYIVVLFKTSNRIITAYEIPEELKPYV